MSALAGNLPKIGNEITVRISLTFQEAPDIHTLLTMTPVRERGKLVRLALERYITETAHPAGDVEQQISAISNWLRSRGAIEDGKASFCTRATPKSTTLDVVALSPSSGFGQKPPPASESAGEMPNLPNSPSINRWLDA